MTDKENDNPRFDFNSFLKTWFPVIITIVTLVLNAVFWIQNAGDEQYYAKISGENLESKVTELREDVRIIRQQNDSMVLSLGRIEGRLDEKSRSDR